MHASFPVASFNRLVLLGAVLLLGVGGIGCESDEPPSSYVARVGSHYLTADELNRRLVGMGAVPDSSAARQQIIEQWVTQTLLYREAQRLNLKSVDSVQQELEQQRRSVLRTALKNRLYNEADLAPTPQEVRTYFERHKEKLRLREPYINARYLAAERPAAAQTVRRRLQTLSPEADSTWVRLVRDHAADTLQARRLSRRFLPERRLLQQLPFRPDQLRALEEGDTAPIVENNGRYHVFRLDRRIPEGTEPRLEWLEPEIRRRLRIRARKQTYTHEVERLRTEAQANDALDTP
ncbi:MAG: peptidyl-prolyl cis-trans isomerase [Salinibacter sp.]